MIEDSNSFLPPPSLNPTVLVCIDGERSIIDSYLVTDVLVRTNRIVLPAQTLIDF
jgi:hypothetical protein